MSTTNFDDMEDDFSAQSAAEESSEPTIYIDKCPKCRGTGIYQGYSSHGSRCFKCDGRGTLAFKTSPEERAKARAAASKARGRKEADKQVAIEAFKAEYPQIVAWWTGSTFEFANSLEQALMQYGHLTERQLASAFNCVAKLEAAKKARAEEQAKTVAAAPTANVDRIEASFTFAMSKGVAKPKLRLGAFKFSPAPASGVNKGAIYVVEKDSDTYLGKVMQGKFLRSRDCTDMMEVGVLMACSDPEAAAVAYGRRTGCCAVCGRELTVGASIDRGIGPICAEKFGW